MSTKKHEVIWRGRIMGAEIRAQRAQEAPREAQRAADRAEAELWSMRMEAFGGPAQPSPTIGQCLGGGLDAIRRPRDTPIWKLEAALKCRSCKNGLYAPPVHVIRLTSLDSPKIRRSHPIAGCTLTRTGDKRCRSLQRSPHCVLLSSSLRGATNARVRPSALRTRRPPARVPCLGR
jgi:hypothetical protein